MIKPRRSALADSLRQMTPDELTATAALRMCAADLAAIRAEIERRKLTEKPKQCR